MATSTLRITYRMGIRAGIGSLKDKAAPNAVGSGARVYSLSKILLWIGYRGDDDQPGVRLRKYRIRRALRVTWGTQ